ncbi:hypothetical protein [Micromonospora sp. C28ISP2-4]|uniref:hypothetical protein n=1 Tax=Micromonospora sp. C28ISP2-4 TaxID=3059523 RepID=UPI00267535A4|nr:hypothetical protein [Micromonospora sp. C28ISP2-4]MDO3686381.1 hypothetical protein [Micromonospora sp. C28ISP2-4]
MVNSALSAVVHAVGAGPPPLAESDLDPGAMYSTFVVLSGMYYAPVLMSGLGFLCAAGIGLSRRIGRAAAIVVVLFYALSLLGSAFTWPELEHQGKPSETLWLIVIGCGGFLVLPWLVAFGGTKVALRRSATTVE